MKTLMPLVCLLILTACATEPQKPTTKRVQIPPNLITEWNEHIINTAIEEDGMLTLKGVRTAALVHTAMHDALNSIVPQYQTYAAHPKDPTADPANAMAEAAFVVSKKYYPDQYELWANEKLKWQNNQASDQAKQAGRSLGQAVAKTLIELRQDDRWNGETDYQWHPMAPGVYAEFNEHSGTPEGFVFGAGWANAKPFTLTSNQQFLVPSPPQINSEAYTQAFNEVKQWGRYDSELRTADQTHLALWWKEFAEISHNKLARELVHSERLELAETTRLFALLNMAIFDAYVNVFYNKFHYNHWRPYTAIRWADHDGNPDTLVDPNWTNTHQHTYAFPSYPSAHGTACQAAMVVLSDVFGQNLAFVMTTPMVDKAGPFSGKMAMDPPHRSFNDFADAAMECSLSRIYLGIHFRYDSIEGNKLGHQIGNHAISTTFKPTSPD